MDHSVAQRTKGKGGRTQANVGERWMPEEGRQMTVVGRWWSSGASKNAEDGVVFLTCKKFATFSNVFGGTPDQRLVSVLDGGRSLEVGGRSPTQRSPSTFIVVHSPLSQVFAALLSTSFCSKTDRV